MSQVIPIDRVIEFPSICRPVLTKASLTKYMHNPWLPLKKNELVGGSVSLAVLEANESSTGGKADQLVARSKLRTSKQILFGPAG
jgi:hypothetical protein